MSDHAPRVTFRDILAVWGPVAIAGQLIMFSQPLIGIGIGQAADHALASAAWPLAFHFSVAISSPALIAQNVATARISDFASFRVTRRFLGGMGCILGALLAVIALTRAGDFVFGTLLNQADPAIIAAAKRTLLVLSLTPPAIALRGAWQGAALARRTTDRVAIATAIRLAVILAITVGGARVLGIPGHIAGALAMVAGLWTEFLALLGQTRDFPATGAVQGRTAATAHDLTLGSFVAFAAPLAAGHLCWTIQRPLINSMIGQDTDALRAFGVLHPLVLFMSTPLWALQSTAIIFGRSASSRAMMVRFGVAASAVMAAIALTFALVARPLGFLEGAYGLDGRALALAAPALVLIALDPLVHGIRSISSGLLIGHGRTRAVGLAAAAKVGVVLAVGHLGLSVFPDANRAMLGLTAYIAGTATDALLFLLLARGVLRET